MERADALARLANMTAASSRPALSTGVGGELEMLLDDAAMIDTYGQPPNAEDWAGAWDLNAAAAEGWRWKAGKVAGDYNFSADDASYSKADVLAHCLEMEATYRAKIVGTSTIRGSGSLLYDPGDLIP
jgi:hypothetical protein